MPFAKEFDDVYQLGIKPACSGAGAYCERLDEQVFDEGMLDRIYNQIAKADIIVADMSSQNSNVFYEVGYAHALGKRVILITKTANDIPFDLKHRFHIVYDGSITTLKARLLDRMSWYVANPLDKIIDGLDHLEFFVNGEPLQSEKLYRTTPESYDKHYTTWRISVAVQNPPDAMIGTLTFMAGLLTPQVFSTCRSSNVANMDSIHLPNKMYLHQMTKPMHLQSGGWMNISFPISCTEFARETEGTYDVALRILGSGPPRDLQFKIENRYSA